MEKIAFILFATMSMVANAQIYKNDLEQENLKGKVEKIEYTSYSLSNPNKVNKRVEHYTPQGDVFEEFPLEYNASSGSWRGGIVKRRGIDYDKRGNKIKVEYYQGRFEVVRTEEYKYDNQSRRTEFWIETQIAYFKTVYKYDAKGNMVQELRYYLDDDGNETNLESKGIYKYDAQGKMVEVLGYEVKNEDGKNKEILQVKVSIKYHPNGKMKEKITKRQEEDGYIKEIYNNKGDLIQEIDTGDQFTYNYQYEYDQFNNWIKQTSGNDVVERKITYGN